MGLEPLTIGQMRKNLITELSDRLVKEGENIALVSLVLS